MRHEDEPIGVIPERASQRQILAAVEGHHDGGRLARSGAIRAPYRGQPVLKVLQQHVRPRLVGRGDLNDERCHGSSFCQDRSAEEPRLRSGQADGAYDRHMAARPHGEVAGARSGHDPGLASEGPGRPAVALRGRERRRAGRTGEECRGRVRARPASGHTCLHRARQQQQGRRGRRRRQAVVGRVIASGRVEQSRAKRMVTCVERKTGHSSTRMNGWRAC